MKPFPALVALFCGRLIAADPALKTETFDRDPGWEGHRTHIVPKEYPTIAQEFGYGGTGFAGKTPGAGQAGRHALHLKTGLRSGCG